MMKPLSRITLVALRLLLLTSIAYGQITTPRPSTTLSTTSSAAAKTHTILVGKGDHTFKPDITEAGVGDVSNPFPPSSTMLPKLTHHRPSSFTSSRQTTLLSAPNTITPASPSRRSRLPKPILASSPASTQSLPSSTTRRRSRSR